MLQRDEEVSNPLTGNLRVASQKKPSMRVVQRIRLTIGGGRQ
jgi:hypothetical protein